MRESRLGDYGSGLAPVTEGWFVVSVRDAEWWSSQTRGARCSFESEYGDPAIEFAQLAINVTVLEPRQTILYHAQANQEAFLVVSGECTLLVEGRAAEPRAVGLLPRCTVDRARLRGRRRAALRDRDGRLALGPGRAPPGVRDRGAPRRERGGGDLRLQTGERGARAVRARAPVELGSSALGVGSSGVDRSIPHRGAPRPGAGACAARDGPPQRSIRTREAFTAGRP